MSSIAGNVELSSLKNAPVGKELCSGARDWTAGAAGWKEDGWWLKLNSGGPSWDLTFALPLPRLDGGVEEPRHVPDPLMRGDGSLMFRWWCVWLVDNSGYEYLNLVQMSSSHHAPSPVTTATICYEAEPSSLAVCQRRTETNDVATASQLRSTLFRHPVVPDPSLHVAPRAPLDPHGLHAAAHARSELDGCKVVHRERRRVLQVDVHDPLVARDVHEVALDAKVVVWQLSMELCLRGGLRVACVAALDRLEIDVAVAGVVVQPSVFLQGH
ncbi:hypothetical protein VFPFJ_02883 [Purpureocillium lilacinum]|uniref:Uncharacterized protein n=1 Tax=Purpureocillium lilacinum TaxID=33203 RepID=A0A179HVY7_PURLI|nr:hypothetical protein VFPFJ_02883 [Purpureocillium lilacinum]OAQ93721.1 hypothetical protein VFPFJ_02883 [Purpureocillium lilacinum]